MPPYSEQQFFTQVVPAVLREHARISQGYGGVKKFLNGGEFGGEDVIRQVAAQHPHLNSIVVGNRLCVLEESPIVF